MDEYDKAEILRMNCPYCEREYKSLHRDIEKAILETRVKELEEEVAKLKSRPKGEVHYHYYIPSTPSITNILRNTGLSVWGHS